jgi:hypothetical protein
MYTMKVVKEAIVTVQIGQQTSLYEFVKICKLGWLMPTDLVISV